ncbi:MAG: right-handed parallel beta-helix repeat-containing protein [Lentisphaerae bacterium]|nr:right-handed parallel beta-helix repeat-containing protein [Lentisphaerota bacterium]
MTLKPKVFLSISLRAWPVLGLLLMFSASLFAQVMSPRYYDPGAPTLTDIWVDPLNGRDGNSGASRAQALRSLDAAWTGIPSDTVLATTGYRILLAAGAYAADSIPNYMERRYGTYACPVVIQAADGQGTATLLRELNIFDCRYLYLVDFNITAAANNLIHGESCTNLLMRGLTLQGDTNTTQETIKMNQCQYVYLEDSDISGAFWMAVDFVAVQYGHIVGNALHNADWVAYLKGGSAYFRIEANEIYDGGTIGFSAGQGTGFEFMISPWLHYEATDIKFINNVVHDIEGAGMGVNGGYNILLAYNTLYRVGRRAHALEAVFGERSCDGDTARCAALRAAGGWGPVSGGITEPIPNRHVYIYNNVLYNPAGYQSADSHLAVYGERAPSSDSNISSPAETDVDLSLRGNIFWNGPPDLALGIGDAGQGGQTSNPTCNPAQFLTDNAVNNLEPQLVNPAGGDFQPLPGGNVFTAATYAIPDFTGDDRPAPPEEPAGNLSNAVNRDYYGNARSSSSPPGAFIQGTTNTAPVASIQANHTDSTISIPADDTLTITAGLAAGAYAGASADWWLAAATQDGAWYYFDYLNAPAQWRAGLAVTWQGPIFDLSSADVLTVSALAPGVYWFYFGVDTVMDGQVTLASLFYDAVSVTVY